MSNTLNLCIAHAFVSNCLFNKIFNQPSFLPSWVSRNISPYLCVLMLCTLCEIIVVSYGVLLLLVAGCFSFLPKLFPSPLSNVFLLPGKLKAKVGRPWACRHPPNQMKFLKLHQNCTQSYGSHSLYTPPAACCKHPLQQPNHPSVVCWSIACIISPPIP